MQLTKLYSLKEACASETAKTQSIDNTPPSEVLPRLQESAEMLQRASDYLGRKLWPTSWYRCEALNKVVGGVANSDHQRGEAVDVYDEKPAELAEQLAANAVKLGIGQVILEGKKGKEWVHLATRIPAKPQNRFITITDAGPVVGIKPDLLKG